MKLVSRLLGLSLALASSNLSALGLGTIHVDSAFGEPFAGTVEIFNAQGFDESSIAISLASRDVHEEMGIVRTSYLDSLSLELIFHSSGSAEIQVSSNTPLGDPYVELAIEMRWPEGRVVRDYTVLLNMPSVPVPHTQESMVSAAKQTATLTAIVPVPHSSLYTLQFGDTLSGIAERLDGREVSLYDATQTLRAHNASLLEARGASGLRAGDRLRIPSKEIFSKPAAPIQSTTSASLETQVSETPQEKTANTLAAQDRRTPLDRAETRLRALGYASLQMKAVGETPNPVIASGAAATILDQLISEQNGGEPLGSSQIGQLAEGLNQIADISREYQRRLVALEETAEANAKLLAELTQKENLIEATGKSTVFTTPEAALVLEPIPKSGAAVESNRIADDTSTQKALLERSSTEVVGPSIAVEKSYPWIVWSVVFGPILIAAVLLFFWRRQQAQSFSAPTAFEEEVIRAPKTPAVREALDSEPTEADIQASGDSDPEPVAAQKEEEEPEPFTQELAEEIATSEPANEEDSFDAELDEELKLISIFEETLAAETAVRSQIKEEESTREQPAFAHEGDFFEFLEDESTEPSKPVEFSLEEEENDSAIEQDEDQILAEELLDEELLGWSQDNDISLPDSPEAEDLPTPPADTVKEYKNTFAGYAESSGFDQINPAEVVDIVSNKLMAAKNAGQESTLFYIEIDQFDHLEKELGIVRAEKLAVTVASSVYDLIDNPITLRRFRQEGFVLLLSGGPNQQNLQFGQEIATSIAATPLEIASETFFVTLSIGVMSVTSGLSNGAEVIETARRVAQEVSEDEGGNGAAIYQLDPTRAHNEASIKRSGRTLMNDNALMTVYQPISALRGDPLEFYEAKLKVIEGAKAEALPDDLIERLGATDLSTEIDCLNLSNALADLKHLLNNHANTRLFVAISARTATDNFFKSWFEKTLFSEGIHPERLVLQMPEDSASRHLNSLIAFRDYAHGMGARICISQLNFQRIPEHALARLHPDFVLLHPELAINAQHEGTRDTDVEKQKQGQNELTEILEKVRPMCEKIIVPNVSQARLIPILWPLSVDYIQGEYIHAESPAMDYEFDQVAE